MKPQISSITLLSQGCVETLLPLSRCTKTVLRVLTLSYAEGDVEGCSHVK
jgi:hypothetical protein